MVSRIRAALLIPYVPIPGLARRPATEETFTTEPPCSPIQASLASRVQASGARTFTARILAAAAGSTSMRGPKTGLIPALLTSMSSRPNVSMVLATVSAW